MKLKKKRREGGYIVFVLATFLPAMSGTSLQCHENYEKLRGLPLNPSDRIFTKFTTC